MPDEAHAGKVGMVQAELSLSGAYSILSKATELYFSSTLTPKQFRAL